MGLNKRRKLPHGQIKAKVCGAEFNGMWNKINITITSENIDYIMMFVITK